MSEANHTVQLTGEFSPGVAPEQAVGALAALMKMPPEKVQALLASAPVSVKKNVDAKTAQLYLERIEQTGVLCSVVPPPGASETPAPEPAPDTIAPSMRPAAAEEEPPPSPSDPTIMPRMPRAAEPEQTQRGESTLNEFLSREADPVSEVTDDTTWRGLRDGVVPDVVEAGAVPIANGIGWVAGGWQLFKEKPWVWIGITLIYGVAVMVIGAIPFIGALAFYLLQPVLVGGVMLGCEALRRGEDLEITHLFKGFDQKTVPLLKLGGLYLGGMVAIVVLSVIIAVVVPGVAAPFAGLSGGGAPLEAMLSVGFLLVLLLVASLMLVVTAMFWFAPPLVMLRDVAPWEAAKLSLSGCVKNVLPFIPYSIVLIVLAVVASIPLMLGWLVLGPIFIASVYAAYRDIYPDLDAVDGYLQEA